MDDRIFSARKSLHLSHACSRDESDQTVQCDVLTHCSVHTSRLVKAEDGTARLTFLRQEPQMRHHLMLLSFVD